MTYPETFKKLRALIQPPSLKEALDLLDELEGDVLELLDAKEALVDSNNDLGERNSDLEGKISELEGETRELSRTIDSLEEDLRFLKDSHADEVRDLNEQIDDLRDGPRGY
jgi:chromosome segregation ATPase